VLNLHDKSEDISAQAAAKAHEDLFFFADIKGGSLFRVERTSGYVISSSFFEGNVFGDERYDIDRTPHFIQNVVRVKGHGKQPPLSSYCQTARIRDLAENGSLAAGRIISLRRNRKSGAGIHSHPIRIFHRIRRSSFFGL
jgi:hypothetical protein